MSRSVSRLSLAACSAVCVAAGLAACVVVPIDPRTGQPYPLPQQQQGQGPGPVTVVSLPPPQAAPQANKAGLLTALVIDQHSGRGSFSVSYLGDTLQGEATRVDNGYAAFGRIHQEVLGMAPMQRSFSGQRGIANGYGSRGVNAQCEYLITGPGIGTGACLFSDGARYQMHFGS